MSVHVKEPASLYAPILIVYRFDVRSPDTVHGTMKSPRPSKRNRDVTAPSLVAGHEQGETADKIVCYTQVHCAGSLSRYPVQRLLSHQRPFDSRIFAHHSSDAFLMA